MVEEKKNARCVEYCLNTGTKIRVCAGADGKPTVEEIGSC